MSKQEEIREKVRTTLVYAYLERITPEDMGAVPEDFEWADEVIKDLSALGVVLLAPDVDVDKCSFVEPLILPEPEAPEPPVTAFVDSCPVCGGLGFIEFNHGILQQQCEACLGTGLSESKVRLEGNGDTITITGEVANDSNAGANGDNQPAGGEDTGKPKRTRKSKSAAKLTKKPE